MDRATDRVLPILFAAALVVHAPALATNDADDGQGPNGETPAEAAVELVQFFPEDPPDPRRAYEGLEKRIGDLEDIHGDLALGGAAWINFERSNFKDGQTDRGGDVFLDLFRVEARGSRGPWEVSAQYRSYDFMDIVHHAWIGYDTATAGRLQAGISQVPFGLRPFASHSYWFGMPYYVGLEDDYQAGVKYLQDFGDWSLQAAYFPNPGTVNASSPNRYPFQVVTDPDNDQFNRQNDQLNFRLLRDVFQDTAVPTELGVSLQGGRLYNEATERHGDHRALGLHTRTRFGTEREWKLELQWADYRFSPENPEGVADDTVQLGAFGARHRVAAEGELEVINIARDLVWAPGAVDGITCYLDYSRLNKRPAAWEDSELRTLGCSVAAGPTFTFIDIIQGRNSPFLNVAGDTALAEGLPSPDRETRFNISLGIYF